MLAGAFELTHLPNRAELRLKTTGKVIGYTLSHVRDERGRVIGAALFFKDLTRVEQLEERERLRDRLAALGEMAAAIAHEVKNPLAGIEVMAGLLKRQLPDSPDAQSLLADIISEAKMANAIVHRGARVRAADPAAGRARSRSPTCSAMRSRWPRATVPRGEIARRRSRVAPDLPPIQGDQHQLCQLFTNLLTNAFEALDGTRRGRRHRARRSWHEETICGAGEPRARTRRSWSKSPTTARRPPEVQRSDLQPVLHDQAAGLRPRPGDRAQDRRRARRAHRRQRDRRRAARGSGSRCRFAEQPRFVQVKLVHVRNGRLR